jgi:hypothetical protein
MEIFCFSAITFFLLYATAFLFLDKWAPTNAPVPMFYRHVISGIGAGVAAVAVGFVLHAVNVTTASARGETALSPLELHRAVGTKQLPVMEIEDRTLVFPNRE